jgi:predicted transcriptional regulator
MTKALLDVIFASGKRKSVLQLLQNGPQEMEHLLTSLDTTRQALLPQIRTLEDHYLVDHHKDTYRLTTIGKLIVDQMAPFVNAAEALDVDIDYWGTHNLNIIPSNLLQRIGDLGKCSIITPKITDLHNEYVQFHEASKSSHSIYVITEFLFPNYDDLFNDLISNNVNIYFIISPKLYEKIKSMSSGDFKRIVQNQLVNLFVYKKELNFLSFGLNDYSLIVRLLRKDNETDTKFIWCKSPEALKWGKDAFEYYLQDSTPITEI